MHTPLQYRSTCVFTHKRHVDIEMTIFEIHTNETRFTLMKRDLEKSCMYVKRTVSINVCVHTEDVDIEMTKLCFSKIFFHTCNSRFIRIDFEYHHLVLCPLFGGCRFFCTYIHLFSRSLFICVTLVSFVDFEFCHLESTTPVITHTRDVDIEMTILDICTNETRVMHMKRDLEKRCMYVKRNLCPPNNGEIRR